MNSFTLDAPVALGVLERRACSLRGDRQIHLGLCVAKFDLLDRLRPTAPGQPHTPSPPVFGHQRNVRLPCGVLNRVAHMSSEPGSSGQMPCAQRTRLLPLSGALRDRGVTYKIILPRKQLLRHRREFTALRSSVLLAVHAIVLLSFSREQRFKPR
jgi:hypothetical protein